MKVQPKGGGEAEFMRYDQAVAAVSAGTHEFVNDEAGTVDQPESETGKDLESQTKAELVKTAEQRGVQIDASATKADILAALKAAEQKSV